LSEMMKADNLLKYSVDSERIECHGRYLSVLFLALVISCLPVCYGCFGSATNDNSLPLTYDFRAEKKISKVVFSGMIEASETTLLSLRDGWGILKWMKTEGSTVASGERCVSIEMNDIAEQLRYNQNALGDSQIALKKEVFNAPLEIAKQSGDVVKKKQEYLLKKEEKAWLLKGKPSDERWKALTDLEKGTVEQSHAKKMYEFQKKVSDRGFDSPFALRRQEIDVLGREIEVDYTKRLLKEMQVGPFPEEIVKSDYQIEVASGETFLAKNQLQTASVSCDIKQKRLDFSVELCLADLRKDTDRFNQREVFSPVTGLMIYPNVWGGKMAPGQEVWEGFTFAKIVGTTSFIIEASVDETQSSLLNAGCSAAVILDSLPDRVFPGKIIVVGKAPKRNPFQRVKSDVKKFPVQLGVDLASFPVKLGMKCSVAVTTKEGDGVFLPRDALKMEGASATVNLVDRWGISTISANIEPFDSDYVKWLNPPASEGTVVY